MDESRIHDMNQLTMVLNSPDESALHKRQACRAINKIKAKMNDPFIKKERERLIRAHKAGDTHEVDKISGLISDYEVRTYGRV